MNFKIETQEKLLHTSFGILAEDPNLNRNINQVALVSKYIYIHRNNNDILWNGIPG
jgi:hypothetical protein